MSEVRDILTESVSCMKTLGGGLDIRQPKNYQRMLGNKKLTEAYLDRLCEGLSDSDKRGFRVIAENTVQNILENSMTQFAPYETLRLPILRKWYPRLIAKELVHVVPVDKPNPIMGFMRAYFGTSTQVESNSYPYQFPYITGDANIDISRGPYSGGVTRYAITGAGEYTIDILDLFSLTSSDAHLDKDFYILGSSSGDSTTLIDFAVPVGIDVDGNFSTEISYDDGTTFETVSGHVDFYAGILNWSSTGTTDQLKYSCKVSLEENKINSRVKFTVDKITFEMVLRQITGDWTIPFEQDIKALYDLDFQSELINIIGEQIAINVDEEIIGALIAGNDSYNDSTTHSATFDKKPGANFYWGRKMWAENILPILTNLSANIYNDTQMGSANVIACNPTEAALLQMLDSFGYQGGSDTGGDVGYHKADIVGGTWKVLVSTIVPAGKMIVKYRGDDLTKAAFVYAPYVPAILTPYPLQSTPSLTVMSRYATKLIRPEAVAVLNVIDSDPTAN